MRKLRLELDDLQVEAFVTEARRPNVGTVHGFISFHCSLACDTVNATCDGAFTCGDTCDGQQYTCILSCGGCGSNRCGTADASCADPSCVDTCTLCNVNDCTVSCAC